MKDRKKSNKMTNLDPKIIDSGKDDFRCVAEKINQMIDGMPDYKTCMVGVRDDILRIKEYLEYMYHKVGFYLSYWKCECPFHGWLWEKDDGTMKAQAQLTDDLTDKMEEMYAMCLKALGEKLEKFNVEYTL